MLVYSGIFAVIISSDSSVIRDSNLHRVFYVLFELQHKRPETLRDNVQLLFVPGAGLHDFSFHFVPPLVRKLCLIQGWS
jgi:hypothetical protein